VSWHKMSEYIEPRLLVTYIGLGTSSSAISTRAPIQWDYQAAALACVQCKEEICRLEVEQAKTMRAIIQRNIVEVSQLCESTGLPTPDLSVILAGSESEGLVAEALHKLNVMLAQLKGIVSQREPIIKQIREVEDSFKEAIWHFQHQQDNLFNNRV
jgi:hypothetical protein